ncbi:MAG: PQQ-binding-like beta-propeller repeat protein [Bryobacterales bacterium]|nr:PQQ-binding-like beta-propeller repeat protein [Bryobacterales bacterium]
MQASRYTFCVLTLLGLASIPASGTDWPRFRGPNGSGIVDASGLPADLGDQRNILWKISLPWGHSSPIISGSRIFLTAAEGGEETDAGREKVVDAGGKLVTFSIDRDNGEILWKKAAPRPRMERYEKTNSPASPSPVTDGENVYVFFGDFGLISYTVEGDERWRLPLGPFNNVNGHGSSPILVDDKVILVCDSDTAPYMLAVDKNTGKVIWKTERPETTRSYVTPAVFQPKEGPLEVIVPSAYFLASYSADTGEKLWWVNGGGWQTKSTPIIHGDMIYSNSWEGGGQIPEDGIPTFAEAIKKADKNGDGVMNEEELKIVEPKRKLYLIDLDHDKLVDQRDWEFHRIRRTSKSSLMAVRHGGRGNLTETDHLVWSLEKFLPNVPSPLIYDNVLYLIKDGGILSTLDPQTGEIFKQGRLRKALDKYYASPVGADGKVYMISQLGQATVLKAGAQWEILTSHDFGEEVYATPAIVENRLYIRTRNTLYCLGRQTNP